MCREGAKSRGSIVMEDTLKKDKIVFIGDVHGEFGKLRFDIRRMHENAYLIQVGDFGVGFHKEGYYELELKKLQDELARYNCHLFVLRGNHDNPAWFTKTHNPFGYENITLLADYTELDLLGKKILCVGGAISIDREHRIEGKSWWEDEVFVLKLEAAWPYAEKKYDIVATHTRPAVCGAFKGFKNIQEWCNNDPTLKNELIEEGQLVDYLYNHTKPAHWFYGHFHESNLITHGSTVFRCLDIDEHILYTPPL